jgi:hypothetical protein
MPTLCQVFQRHCHIGYVPFAAVELPAAQLTATVVVLFAACNALMHA